MCSGYIYDYSLIRAKGSGMGSKGQINLVGGRLRKISNMDQPIYITEGGNYRGEVAQAEFNWADSGSSEIIVESSGLT